MKLASFEAIVSALNRSEVRYLVAGGLAVVAHGYGRVTFDVDLVIQLNDKNVVQALRALGELGYRPLVPVRAEEFADPDKRRRWIEEKNMVVFQLHSDEHPDTRIDIFVKEPFDFDTEYGAALKGEVLPGIKVRFVSAGTLIAMKKLANRDKDRDDINQLEKILQRDGRR